MVELLLSEPQTIKAFHDLHLAIIPTVLIPLTALTVALTSMAGMVAGWFGIKLHTEGPKQLLEVLLRKQVLVSMLLLNLAGWGIYKSYVYVQNMPSFIYTIEHYSRINAVASEDHYSDSRMRNHDFSDEGKVSGQVKVNLIKEIKIPMGAFRSGVASGHSLFYGVDDGNIYEFDKSTLSVKRKFYIGKQVSTRPVIFKNMIYAGEGNHYTHHARIYAFDLGSGKFSNAFQTTGHTEGQPVIANVENTDVMFITAGIDGLYALTPALKQLWHIRDGHLDGTVTVENKTVYMGTGVEKGSTKDRSYASAYEYLSGKLLWKKELPLSNWMHPVVTSTDVCYVLGEIYTPSSIGQLYCLNKLTGSPHFSIPFDSPIASKPVYLKTPADEMIFFGGLDGNVCGVSISKKEKIWCKSTSRNPTKDAFSSVDYDPVHGILIYPSFDNGLFAFSPSTGDVKFHWVPLKGETAWLPNSASVTIDENNIYHMDLEGHLRKFNLTTL